MTNAQLEVAAQQYCRLQGMDPMEIIEVEGTVLKSPRFVGYMPKIKQVWIVQEAIMFALRTKPFNAKPKINGKRVL